MANTLASGASARKGLEVQLLSWASTNLRLKPPLYPNFVRPFYSFPLEYALPSTTHLSSATIQI